MSERTSNLGLLKKDPIADRLDTFSVGEMLNENWDRIDQEVGEINTQIESKLDVNSIAKNSEKLGGLGVDGFSKTNHNHDLRYLSNGYGKIVSKDGDFEVSEGDINVTISLKSGAVITVAKNDNIPVGTQIIIFSHTVDKVSFVSGDDTVLLSKENNRIIDGSNVGASLIKIDNNTWQLVGALKGEE